MEGEEIDFSALNVEQISSENLRFLLKCILSPNTKTVNGATKLLKRYFEKPESMNILLEELRSNEDQGIRLLSALCLRRKLTQHWVSVNKAGQIAIKNLLLELFSKEPSLKVKENIAGVVGHLASLLLPNADWPELIPFIHTCQSNPDALIQRQGILLLSQIVDAIGNLVEGFADQISPLIYNGLISPHLEQRLLGVKAFSNIAEHNLSLKCLLKFQSLVPHLVNAAATGDDETILHDLFDTFSDLVELQQFLTPHLELLFKSAMDIASNKTYSENLRIVCLYFVQNSAESKGKLVKKKKDVLNYILDKSFMIVGEDEEAYDLSDETPIDAALDLLEEFSIHLPNKVIFEPLMNAINTLLQSPNKLHRKAALDIFGVISHGLDDPMKEKLDQMIELPLKYFTDPEPIVREAAIMSIANMTGNLSPEIIEKHSVILPKVMEAFTNNQQSAKLATRILFVFEVYCEAMVEDEIEPYIVPLLQKLVPYLDLPELGIKQRAMGAISSVCIAAKEHLIAFHTELIAKLMTYLEHPDSVCRGKAISALGYIGLGVGMDLFKPYLEQLSTTVFNMLLDGGPNFHNFEAAYNYFGSVAQIMKEDFTPLLDKLVPLACKTCLSEEGIKKSYKDKDFSLDTDSDSDESEEEETMATRFKGMSVRSDFIDEKTSAIHMLGMFAVHVPVGFLHTHIDIVLTTFEGLWNYFHFHVRYQLMQSYGQIMEGINSGKQEGKPPKIVKGLPTRVALHPDCMEFYKAEVLPKIIESIQIDEEKEVVIKTLETLSSLIQTFGPGMLEHRLDDLVKCLHFLLIKDTNCQKGGEEGEEEEDEEDIDHDEMILANLTDCINKIAEYGGSPVIPNIKQLMDDLLKYIKPPHPHSDIVVGVGFFADCFKFTPSTISDYIQILYPVCMACPNEDNDLGRNAAYLLGTMVEGNCQLVAPKIPQILEKLNAFHASCTKNGVKDNVIAAVSRIIKTCPELLPLATLLPVFFNNIPLNEDKEENPTVCQLLLHMAQKGNIVYIYLIYIYKLDITSLNGYERNVMLTLFKTILDPKVLTTDEIKTEMGNAILNLLNYPNFKPIFIVCVLYLYFFRNWRLN